MYYLQSRSVTKMYLFVLLPILSSCGGGDTPGTTVRPPTVEYAKTLTAGAGSVADYMNAEWLYQNYLGEYGLPEEVKPMFLPELQMLANGFALQFKRGEDVEKSITQFHQAAMMLHASGQLAQFFTHAADHPQQLLQQNSDESGLLRAPPPAREWKDAELDEDARLAVAKAKQREDVLAGEWEKVRDEYDLPYELPGKVEKWFVYDHAMKGKGASSTTLPAVVRSHNMQTWSFDHGDFALVRNPRSGGFPNPFGHVGMIDRWQLFNSVLEAVPGGGVRRFTGLQAWGDQYSTADGYGIRLGWASWWLTNATYNTCFSAHPAYKTTCIETYIRKWAVENSAARIGQTYNWVFPNKRADSSTYCSQLVWQAYAQFGIDLDYDGGAVVYPTDLTRSRWVYMKMGSSI